MIAGADPPLIDLPLIVKSWAPVRLITADAVYGDDEDDVVVATAVDEELVVATGVAVVVEPPAAGLAVTVGAGVPAAGVVAVVGVAGVPVVAGDEAVKAVVAGLAGATIGSFLQEDTRKAIAKKKAKESLVRPFRPSPF